MISDNWLLQDAAIAASRLRDPSEEATWVGISPTGFTFTPTLTAVHHLQCLGTLLEQIVLAEGILVLEEWTRSWTSISDALAQLLASGVILTMSRAGEELTAPRQRYLTEFARSPGIRSELEEDKRKSAVDVIVKGTSTYLALSDVKGLPYSPHPVRARVLDQTLWHPGWPSLGVARSRELLTAAHIQLNEVVGDGASLVTLVCDLPPIAAFCLAESSNQRSPIDIAIELRVESEVRSLRTFLGDMSNAFSSGETAACIRLSKQLEAAVSEAERRLRLRDSPVSRSPTQLTLFSLPIAVPSILQRPVITPRHTGILHRIMSGSAVDFSKLMADKMGWRQKNVLEALRIDSKANRRSK